MFLAVGILCNSHFVLAKVIHLRPVTLKFSFGEKVYTYHTEVGHHYKKNDSIIIENDRLYVKYDGPQFFKKEVLDKKKIKIEKTPNELYEKFIYVGKVQKAGTEKGFYYQYIDDPNSPAFKLVTEDQDVVYDDTPSDTKITGITFFRNLSERDSGQIHPTEQLEKLEKYEQEYYDAYESKIKKEKLDSEIEKTKQEIEKLQKQLDELQKERKACE